MSVSMLLRLCTLGFQTEDQPNGTIKLWHGGRPSTFVYALGTEKAFEAYVRHIDAHGDSIPQMVLRDVIEIESAIELIGFARREVSRDMLTTNILFAQQLKIADKLLENAVEHLWKQETAMINRLTLESFGIKAVAA